MLDYSGNSCQLLKDFCTGSTTCLYMSMPGTGGTCTNLESGGYNCQCQTGKVLNNWYLIYHAWIPNVLLSKDHVDNFKLLYIYWYYISCWQLIVIHLLVHVIISKLIHINISVQFIIWSDVCTIINHIKIWLLQGIWFCKM